MPPETEHLIQTCCPVCAEANVRPVKPYRGESKLFWNRYLVHCSNCELAFTHPMPSQDELDHYNASYFENAHSGAENSVDARLFASAIAKLRLRHIEAYIKSREITLEAVLEIGPGLAFFYRHFMERYPHAEYVVVETDLNCRQHLEKLGLPVYESLGLLSDEYLNRFDLVVASHVLEHIADPVAFTHGMAEKLKPGGVMFIEVPCRDYEFKERDEPHLLFFDRHAMGKLLAEIGLDDLKTTYHGRVLKRLQRDRSYYVRCRMRLNRLWRRLLRATKAIGQNFRGKIAQEAPPLEIQTSIDGQAEALLAIENLDERNVVEPFEAHLTQAEPAWWLRALARRPYC